MGLRRAKRLSSFLIEQLNPSAIKEEDVLHTTPVFCGDVCFGCIKEGDSYIYSVRSGNTVVHCDEVGSEGNELTAEVVREIKRYIKDWLPEWKDVEPAPNLSDLLGVCKKQGISLLKLDGKTLGFRACIYTGILQYYDFSMNLLQSEPDIYEFLKCNQSKFTVCELVRSNGRLYTQGELMNGYDVKELDSKKAAVEILGEIKKFYERGYL